MTIATQKIERQLIAQKIQRELIRASRDGIDRETLPTAREGQLAGYLAGLRAAKRLAQ